MKDLGEPRIASRFATQKLRVWLASEWTNDILLAGLHKERDIVLPPFVGTRFQVLFHSPRRGSFRLSLTVLVHYRSEASI